MNNLSAASTQKLIELVKQQPCLYDSCHKEYKNVATKHEIWEAIGKELNSTGDIVKNKWKTLRDAFTKNKKQLKENALAKTYTWAPMLSFLENHLQKHPTVDILESSPISMDLDPFISLDNQTYSDKESPPPPDEPVPVDGPEIQQHKPTKRKAPQDDDVSRILNFLEKKRKKDDAISLLFLSYSETFRKFPRNEQIALKVQLAKLFSDVELKLLDDVERNHYILSTDEDRNLLQVGDEEIIRPSVNVKLEADDRTDCNHDEEHLTHIDTDIKLEPSETDYNNAILAQQLKEKEEALEKSKDEVLTLLGELDALKTRNSALENRNASLEAAVDDLKLRLNNLV